MHACTFGGNPIAACAGLAAIAMIEQENLLQHARRLGEIFRQRFDAPAAGMRPYTRRPRAGRNDRHRALHRRDADVKACLERKLLVNCTHGTVIRLLPAMNLTEQQAHEGCDILADVLKHQAGANNTVT